MVVTIAMGKTFSAFFPLNLGEREWRYTFAFDSIEYSNVKTKYFFDRVFTDFRSKNKTEVVRILVNFQASSMSSHINGKLSPRPFE